MDLKILTIASNTDNIKIIDNYTHYSKFKNRLCGDEIEMFLKINNEKVSEISYKTNSCVYCQASANLLLKNVKNKNLKKIQELIKCLFKYFESRNLAIPKKLSSFKKIISKKYSSRKECIQLPFRALDKAIK